MGDEELIDMMTEYMVDEFGSDPDDINYDEEAWACFNYLFGSDEEE